MIDIYAPILDICMSFGSIYVFLAHVLAIVCMVAVISASYELNSAWSRGDDAPKHFHRDD
jgi:hypothetical protein